MTQLQLSLPEGRRLKREGMDLIAGHNSAWINLMLGHLVAFAWGRQEFTFELFRMHAQLEHLPDPTSPKCWGSLSLAAQRAGIVEWTGRYIPASSVKTHAHPIRVLRAMGIAYG